MNNSKLKILIVEDHVFIADHIRDILLEEYQFVEAVYDIEEFKEKIVDFDPDLLLLDINIEGNDEGIELAKKYEGKKKVIYITGQNDIKTIDKAIQYKPTAYLTKPIRKSELFASVRLVESQLKDKTIVLKHGYEQLVLNENDIIYIKSERNYIDIYTKKEKITLRLSLENFLLEHTNQNYIRVHRSYIVNKNNITKVTSKSIFIETLEIPISRGFKID
jgi:DNA-binding LytR/AlgR family response regulator